MSSASAVLGVVLLFFVALLMPLHQAPCFCCSQPPTDLPRICHGEPLRDGPVVRVEPGRVQLDGVRIEAAERLAAARPRAVAPLVALLTRKRELYQRFHPARPSPSHVTLEISGDVPTGIVKSVAASCASAGFTDLDFMGVTFCP